MIPCNLPSCRSMPVWEFIKGQHVHQKSATWCSAGTGEVDADFALAVQLQQEEEHRAAARQQQSQQHAQRGSSQSRQQSSSRVGSRGPTQGRPPSGRASDQGVQSFANPMQRPRSAQQTARQEQEKPSIGSTFAKLFGFGSKK